MNLLRLSISGVGVEVAAEDGPALEPLARDFRHFVSEVSNPEIRLDIRRGAPPRSADPKVWLPWRSMKISGAGPRRRVDYPGGARLEYDLDRERGTLWAENSDLAHELSYLAVLSRAGWKLDRRGLHRVHALGFTYRGGAGLILLPSGGGKSRLGLELLSRPGFGFLSDDAPLIREEGLEVSPFPLRLSLRGEDWRGIPENRLSWFHRRRFGPKRLVDLEYFSSKVAGPAPLRWIFAGRPARAGELPSLRECSPARAASALAVNLTLGLGTPQVLELMLPGRALRGVRELTQVAWSRSRCAAAAAARARRAVFTLGGDPARAADALEQYLLRSLS